MSREEKKKLIELLNEKYMDSDIKSMDDILYRIKSAMYATNEDDEYLTDETIAAELARQYADWESLDSCFFDEERDCYVSEYDNMDIEDIDIRVNYHPDGTPIGHDTTTWTKICEIEVE